MHVAMVSGVHITVYIALLNCLCALSTSAFIEPSLCQLDFFLEIFNGDITFISSCIFIKSQLTVEKQKVTKEKKQLKTENQRVKRENEQLITENQRVKREKEQLITENQRVTREKEQFRQQVSSDSLLVMIFIPSPVSHDNDK